MFCAKCLLCKTPDIIYTYTYLGKIPVTIRSHKKNNTNLLLFAFYSYLILSNA